MAGKKTLTKKEAVRLAREQLARYAEQKRYPLNMRTTKSVRERLERAAAKSGRSLAQEVERRLERSLDLDEHLVVAHGDMWAPILVAKEDELWAMLGDDPRDFPVPEGDPPHAEHLVVLNIEPGDLKRLRNYFSGAPYPWDYSSAEIKEAGERWVEQQIDLKRGK
jgi:hypothetical protein